MKSFSLPLMCLALVVCGASAEAQNVPAKTATIIGTAPLAPLTLEESIRLALRLNGQPEASALQAEGAQRRITAARAAYYPQVTASAGYDYLNQSIAGVPATGGVGFGGTNSTLTTNLGVTQNLFDSGRTRQQVRAAQAQSRGALGSFGSARSALAFAVAQRFYEQLRQQKLTEQFQGQVALAAQQVAQVRAQIEAGTAARVDILGVQVTLQQARFDLVTAQNNLATARVNFRNVLGLGRGPALQLVESSRVTSIAGLTSVLTLNTPINPAAPEIAPSVSAPLFPMTNAAPPDDAPNVSASGATTSNTPNFPALQEVAPNVSATEVPAPNAPSQEGALNAMSPSAPNVAAPNATPQLAPPNDAPIVKVPELPQLPAATEILNIAPPDVPQLESLETYLARAQKLRPDLLQSRAAVQQSETAVALAEIERRPQVTAGAGYNLDPRSTGDRRLQLGLGLTLPIFDAGGRRASTRAAQDELEAAKVTLAQLQKDVAADVEASYTDIAGQVERIANARVLVEQAQINLATATEKYRLGLGIVLDIVNAQTQLFNAQVSATQAVYDYEIARAALDRAVGRFAWADPGQAPPVAAPKSVEAALKRAP